MSIIGNKDNDKKLNPLEKQLEEINEWQKNATNPGYFTGSGKVPLPMKNLLKSPIVMLIVGIIFMIPTIHNLVSVFSIANIISNLMTIIIGSGLIFGGIIRILKRN